MVRWGRIETSAWGWWPTRGAREADAPSAQARGSFSPSVRHPQVAVGLRLGGLSQAARGGGPLGSRASCSRRRRCSRIRAMTAGSMTAAMSLRPQPATTTSPCRRRSKHQGAGCSAQRFSVRHRPAPVPALRCSIARIGVCCTGIRMSRGQARIAPAILLHSRLPWRSDAGSDATDPRVIGPILEHIETRAARDRLAPVRPLPEQCIPVDGQRRRQRCSAIQRVAQPAS